MHDFIYIMRDKYYRTFPLHMPLLTPRSKEVNGNNKKSTLDKRNVLANSGVPIQSVSIGANKYNMLDKAPDKINRIKKSGAYTKRKLFCLETASRSAVIFETAAGIPYNPRIITIAIKG